VSTRRSAPPRALHGRRAAPGPLGIGLCLGLALGPRPAAAAAPETGAARWLLDHLAVDSAGIVGWRAGWVDAQHDGFLAIGGGGEVNLGLEFGGGYAVLAGGRAFTGVSSGADAGAGTLSYLEASGHIGAQVRIADWVRLGAGGSVGRIWRGASPGAGGGPGEGFQDGVSLLAGGFLRCGVDWLPRQNATLLRALSLWLRLDLTGHPRDDGQTLPRSSMALGLGLGLRL
jgi:hypothetical protein